VIAAAATSHGALEGSLSFDARAGAMSGGATSGMSREERKLVAAVERFQKLEEDRQRKEEARKRPADAAAQEAAGAPTQQRRRAEEIASSAEQRDSADASDRAERDCLIGCAVSKFCPAQARSYSGTVLQYHCATDSYTILYENDDSEVVSYTDLQCILTPVPAVSTATAATGAGKRRRCGNAANAGGAEPNKKNARSRCPHDRDRSRCKECGGSGICQHQRIRRQCKECGGSKMCQHRRRRSECKECGGSSICPHQRQRSKCKERGDLPTPAHQEQGGG